MCTWAIATKTVHVVQDVHGANLTLTDLAVAGVAPAAVAVDCCLFSSARRVRDGRTPLSSPRRIDSITANNTTTTTRSHMTYAVQTTNIWRGFIQPVSYLMVGITALIGIRTGRNSFV